MKSGIERITLALVSDQPRAGAPEHDRFEVLATLVEDWEERCHPIYPPDPVAAIRFRMEQLSLDRTALEPSIANTVALMARVMGLLVNPDAPPPITPRPAWLAPLTLLKFELCCGGQPRPPPGRVFCHAHGDRLALLVGGLDKGQTRREGPKAVAEARALEAHFRLAAELIRLRKQRGLTQRQLCERNARWRGPCQRRVSSLWCGWRSFTCGHRYWR